MCVGAVLKAQAGVAAEQQDSLEVESEKMEEEGGLLKKLKTRFKP